MVYVDSNSQVSGKKVYYKYEYKNTFIFLKDKKAIL